MAGLAFAAAVLLAASLAAAQRTASSPSDWGQWRGPKRDNLSAETGLLKQWPDKGPPLVGIDLVEEGVFDADGKWVAGRRLNGDQTHPGRHIRLPPGKPQIQSVRFYRVR